MPHSPPRACCCQGCPTCQGRCDKLVPKGYCDDCRTPNLRRTSPGHLERQAIYRTARWKAVAKRVKREQPWCATPGCTSLTEQVDHIIPLVVLLASPHPDPYARDALQGLCRRCHGVKTRTEDRVTKA